MPSTRSKSNRKTRSSSKSAIPLGSQGSSSGIKRRQVSTKSKLKTAKLDDWKTKIGLILWNLVKKYFPFLKIVLEPFKSKHPSLVFLVIALLLTVYPFWSLIVTSASGFWQKFFTAELPSVYFNEVSWPPRQRWMRPEGEVLNAITQIRRLCKDHDGKQTLVYLIGGPGSGSERARQVGRRLFESLKQNNKPVGVITIDAASITSLISSLVDAVLVLCSNLGKTADGLIKQLKDEIDLRVGDQFLNESNIHKTKIKLKVIFTKLMELFKERNSQPVLIFNNVQDLYLLLSYLEPEEKHFATLVVIVALQRHMSLKSLSEYVHVQDLYKGMMPTDPVKLLQLIIEFEEDIIYRMHSEQQCDDTLTHITWRLKPEQGPGLHIVVLRWTLPLCKDFYMVGNLTWSWKTEKN